VIAPRLRSQVTSAISQLGITPVLIAFTMTVLRGLDMEHGKLKT
jgi:hypothetical protein